MIKPKKRKRALSLDAEIKRSAKQIYATGMAEAMRAATLGIVARKLDEIRAILAASGLGMPTTPVTPLSGVTAAPPSPPTAPPVLNPCVECGRQGAYRSKPHKFNPKGSWYCRGHMALAGKLEAEDAMATKAQPANGATLPVPLSGTIAPPSAPPVEVVAPAIPSGLAMAMGLAELADG